MVSEMPSTPRWNEELIGGYQTAVPGTGSPARFGLKVEPQAPAKDNSGMKLKMKAAPPDQVLLIARQDQDNDQAASTGVNKMSVSRLFDDEFHIRSLLPQPG